MPQRPVEIILLKQLASCLATPMLVIGPERDLLFFNEPAEPILGRRFEEWGEISLDDWSTLVKGVDDAGDPIDAEERPMIMALESREPANRRFWLRGLDGVRRNVEVTAIPLIGTGGDLLGALGLFWERGVDRKEVRPADDAGSGHHEVETILMRRLAAHLAMPVYIIDADGHLLYFNAAAEPVLGRRFEDLGAEERDQLYETFRPTQEDGSVLATEHNPLYIARMNGEPAHLRFEICGLDGVPRHIEGTAIPLIGQSNRMLGAVGLFWEIEAT